jgi:hypothetical protein
MQWQNKQSLFMINAVCYTAPLMSMCKFPSTNPRRDINRATYLVELLQEPKRPLAVVQEEYDPAPAPPSLSVGRRPCRHSRPRAAKGTWTWPASCRSGPRCVGSWHSCLATSGGHCWHRNARGLVMLPNWSCCRCAWQSNVARFGGHC